MSQERRWRRKSEEERGGEKERQRCFIYETRIVLQASSHVLDTFTHMGYRETTCWCARDVSMPMHASACACVRARCIGERIVAISRAARALICIRARALLRTSERKKSNTREKYETLYAHREHGPPPLLSSANCFPSFFSSRLAAKLFLLDESVGAAENHASVVFELHERVGM